MFAILTCMEISCWTKYARIPKISNCAIVSLKSLYIVHVGCMYLWIDLIKLEFFMLHEEEKFTIYCTLIASRHYKANHWNHNLSFSTTGIFIEQTCDIVGCRQTSSVLCAHTHMLSRSHSERILHQHKT